MKKDEVFEIARALPTPCYLYFSEKIRASYLSLSSHLPPGVKIFYSVKANPHPGIISALRGLGSAFDVSSSEEIRRVRDQGTGEAELSFIGPGKSRADLELAVQSEKYRCDLIIAESVDELREIDAIAAESGRRQRVLLRVNLDHRRGPNGRLIEGMASQFGIDESGIPAAIDVANSLKNISPAGLHLHFGSHFLEASRIAWNIRAALTCAEGFRSRLPGMNIVNVGGGFGVPYLEGELAINLPDLATELAAVTRDFRPLLDKVTLCVESGRFLTAASGVFLTRVRTMKTSRDRNYLVVDGGFSNHMSAAGFGQAIKSNQRMALLAPGPTPAERREYTIAGPSCYAMDVIGRDVSLPPVKLGDLLCLFNAGAYGLTFSPNRFLGLPVAQEHFL